MQTIQSHQSTEAQPLVSFIIPIFNIPSDMLKECIESIRQLTLRTFEREIIIVDDGSDQMPTDFLADDIIYIRKRNEGVATARNIGLKMASGKFIQFIDGDDMLCQVAYEHVLDMTRYTDADMVMFDFTESGKPVLKYNDDEPMTGSELLRKSNIHGSAWGYLFKRSIMGDLRFTPGIEYGEDEEFTPQLLLRAERVYRTTAKAYHYRFRPTSAIHQTDARKTLKRLNDSKDVIYGLYAKYDKIPYAERLALQRRVAQLTMDYIYNIIVMTQNRQYLNKRLEELKSKGLFPLPDQNYTKKYVWFRRMTNSSIGISILMRTLPLMNRER